MGEEGGGRDGRERRSEGWKRKEEQGMGEKSRRGDRRNRERGKETHIYIKLAITDVQ